MAKVVLDASAILVLLHDEPGAAAVAEALDEAAVSAVNLSEVVAKLLEAGMPRDEAEDVLGGSGWKFALSMPAPHGRRGVFAPRPRRRGSPSVIERAWRSRRTWKSPRSRPTVPGPRSRQASR